MPKAKTKARKAPRAKNTPNAELATAKDYAATTFEAIVGNPDSFKADWDHRRGYFARVVALLLQCDDKEMERRYLQDGQTAHAFLNMHNEIMGEIEYLKIHAEMLNTCAMRMLCVASRAPESWTANVVNLNTRRKAVQS